MDYLFNNYCGGGDGRGGGVTCQRLTSLTLSASQWLKNTTLN